MSLVRAMTMVLPLVLPQKAVPAERQLVQRVKPVQRMRE
jgi:hypothetical protein